MDLSFFQVGRKIPPVKDEFMEDSLTVQDFYDIISEKEGRHQEYDEKVAKTNGSPL